VPESEAPTAVPPKVIVQASNNGSMDTESTLGLVAEITHWLEYSPGIVVRHPRHGLVGSEHDPRAASDDVDHVLWIAVGDDDDGVTVRWDLVDATGSGSPAFEDASLIRGELPHIPPAVATAVLSELGVDEAGAPSLSSRDSADNADAYRDFLRLLGGGAGAGSGQHALLARIDDLEELQLRLSDYAPVATALGTGYLDLAGLVGGQGPYYQMADEELVRAFELDPEYPPARVKLASFFAKVGKSEESVGLLADGLATHPYFPAFHQTLGYVLRYAGLMEESMASYRRSQELDSTSGNLVSAQDQITKSLIYLGDYDEALASHRRMLSFVEESGREPNEKQWFYEGVIHLYKTDYEAAVGAFREGARLDPESVWTTFGRAYEGMALGDTAAVEAVLDELERRDVVDGERHYRLVHFATFTGDLDRALTHLRRTTDGGFFNASYLANDPWVAPLRTDVRFRGMLRSAQARHDAIDRRLQGVDRTP
jgi:tetratricopeptide (TPR) repeat protein